MELMAERVRRVKGAVPCRRRRVFHINARSQKWEDICQKSRAEPHYGVINPVNSDQGTREDCTFDRMQGQAQKLVRRSSSGTTTD
jgi:hypothetical protein